MLYWVYMCSNQMGDADPVLVQRILPMLISCWANIADGDSTLSQHCMGRCTGALLVVFLVGPTYLRNTLRPLCGSEGFIGPSGPANTKHMYNICTMLDQRRRRWADVVQMLYKCFVFAGGGGGHPFYPPPI